MWNTVKKILSRTDWLLLTLCLIASIWGIIMISSATNLNGGSGYVTRQTLSLVLGLIIYFIISAIDMEVLAEHQTIVILFSVLFLLLLYPFGVEEDTGNRSWLSIPGLPFMIQPAEYCKILFIIVIARTMSVYREHINSPRCWIRVLFITGLYVGLIQVISNDTGVALIYLFVLLIMAIAGGFHPIWFILLGAGLLVGIPTIWNSSLLREDQKQRISVIFDSTVDPDGLSVRFQSKRCLTAITGGGLTGQGLYNGALTQANSIPAQHTDCIFAVIGEELGFFGCFLCIALLLAIILRIFYIGTKTESFFYRQICIGIGGMLLFQMSINIGMCLGLTPVIGLTLPFFSYGGSSMLSLFAAMGVISSIRIHPSPDFKLRYIQIPA